MTKHTIHIIAGPTAGGKSAAALNLAARENGVIINCDSLQIYDGLALLTAQPSAEDFVQTSHKLYAHLHPNDVCSAGNWREMVIPVIEEVLAQGKTPIIVGGTGLYIKALVDGLSPIPDIPEEVRAAAVEKQKALGNPAFHEALKKRDPVMAARFHPYHRARLVRAWEVLEATGKSLAEWQKLPRAKPPESWRFDIKKIIPERAVLHERCNARFLLMMDNGVLDEVSAFKARIDSGEIRSDVPLTKALGFKALCAYLAGNLSKEEAIEQAQAQTRQYAKRQITWVRGQL